MEDQEFFVIHQANCLIFTDRAVCNCWPDYPPLPSKEKKARVTSRSGRRKRSRMIKLAAIQGGWRCHYCKKSLTPIFDTSIPVPREDPNRPTIDHVRPVSKGGPTHDITNQVLSCADCNEQKGDTL